jgi:hypothetical protein
LILRLFRGRAPAERAGDVASALAGRFLDAARAMHGLSSYAAGLRVDGDTAQFVIASTWDAVDDVVRQTHGTLDQPATPLLDFMEPEGAEHYELVGDPVPIIVAPPAAVVRVAHMAIRTDREEEFYRAVRQGLAEVGPTGDLLAYHLGRRVENGHEAAVVSVWRSAEALGRVVAPGRDAPLWPHALEPLIDRFRVEHFDLIVVRPV